MAYYLDGKGTQLVVLAVAERLRGGNDDALARMDAERVEVLHVADRDAVVVLVAHHFIFNLLPSFQGLFDQHLRRKGKGFLGLCQQFVVVVAEARTKSAEGVCGTKDDGETQFVSGLLHFLDSAASLALDGLHANLVESLDKEVAVFCVDDCLDRRAKDFDTIFGKDTFLIKLHAAVQGRLSAEAQQDTIRPLLLYDMLHELRRNRPYLQRPLRSEPLRH